MIAVIFFDGFSKPDNPGSFWSPAETSVGIGNLGNLGIAFGLFMAGACISGFFVDCTQVSHLKSHSSFLGML